MRWFLWFTKLNNLQYTCKKVQIILDVYEGFQMKLSRLYKAVSCFGGHIERHLIIIKTIQSNKSLKEVL